MENTFLIAGVQSGVGKTSITLGLVKALTRKGFQVQTFKVGPDYLDPTWLSRASNKACYNLDTFMTTPEYVSALFHRASMGVDINIIEGVMGLYDGADVTSIQGSTADISILLNVPILLIVDAKGMAGSIAAMVKGYLKLDNRVRIAGVIANNCGSKGHAELLAKALDHYKLPKLIGYVLKEALPALPERHLGLYASHLFPKAEEILNKLASGVSETIDLSSLLPSRLTSHLTRKIKAVQKRKTVKVRIAIAKDEAFYFYYPDNLSLLEDAGAEIVSFSPLKDQVLPQNISMIYLGGGYPEAWAKELSKNDSMIKSIQNFAQKHHIYAECGGLMYLSKGLRVASKVYRFCSILPTFTEMLTKSKVLGYRITTLQKDCLLGPKNSILRGHEFHYSRLTDESLLKTWYTTYKITNSRKSIQAKEGYAHGKTLCSYVHQHFASNPATVNWLMNYIQ